VPIKLLTRSEFLRVRDEAIRQKIPMNLLIRRKLEPWLRRLPASPAETAAAE